ncbi:MAG: hypothetical protein IPG91_13725 [Ideonella sp.]|nr:hypothetical protein [Ideonella sp.]
MNRFATYLVPLAVAATLSACYVVPVRGPDGAVYYDPYPLPPVGAPIPAPAAPQGQMPGAQMPAVLNARMYPTNEAAAAGGVISGTVTNLMTGKGRFQVNYLGEILTGEATRVSNEDKRGVASAYGSKGTIMSCDYQMTTPYQGTGDCRISTGATYKLHLGGN